MAETQYKPTAMTLGDLKPHPENPRYATVEVITGLGYSIAEFGDLSGIVLNCRNGYLVAGHQRKKALEEKYGDKLKFKKGVIITPDGGEFRVRVVDWDEAKHIAAMLAANNPEIQGSWTERLKGLVAEAAHGCSLEAFTAMNMESLRKMATGGRKEPLKDDPVPEPPAKPITKLGDVWVLGDQRLVCGDATDLAVWDAVMQGETSSLLITDPPYNVDYVGKTADALTIDNDAMDDRAFRELLIESLGCSFKHLVAGGAFYIFHADSEGYNFRGAVRECGEVVRQCLIWVKSAMVMGRQDYHWRHEPCLYGWKAGAAHSWQSDRKQTTVLEFDRPNASKLHPTMKPVALIGYLVGNSTVPGCLVTDPFLGSGTSLVVAEQMERRCRGIELDPAYCDVIVERWEQLTGGKAERG